MEGARREAGAAGPSGDEMSPYSNSAVCAQLLLQVQDLQQKLQAARGAQAALTSERDRARAEGAAAQRSAAVLRERLDAARRDGAMREGAHSQKVKELMAQKSTLENQLAGERLRATAAAEGNRSREAALQAARERVEEAEQTARDARQQLEEAYRRIERLEVMYNDMRSRAERQQGAGSAAAAAAGAAPAAGAAQAPAAGRGGAGAAAAGAAAPGSALQDTVAQLRQQLADKEELVLALQEELDRAKEAYTVMDADHDAERAAREQVTREKEQLEGQVERLTAEREQLKERVAQLSQEAEDLRRELEAPRRRAPAPQWPEASQRQPGGQGAGREVGQEVGQPPGRRRLAAAAGGAVRVTPAPRPRPGGSPGGSQGSTRGGRPGRGGRAGGGGGSGRGRGRGRAGSGSRGSVGSSAGRRGGGGGGGGGGDSDDSDDDSDEPELLERFPGGFVLLATAKGAVQLSLADLKLVLAAAAIDGDGPESASLPPHVVERQWLEAARPGPLQAFRMQKEAWTGAVGQLVEGLLALGAARMALCAPLQLREKHFRDRLRLGLSGPAREGPRAAAAAAGAFLPPKLQWLQLRSISQQTGMAGQGQLSMHGLMVAAIEGQLPLPGCPTVWGGNFVVPPGRQLVVAGALNASQGIVRRLQLQGLGPGEVQHLGEVRRRGAWGAGSSARAAWAAAPSAGWWL